MKVEIVGKNLVITLPMNATPESSTSGKSLIIASTGGNKESEIKVNGKPVIIGCNAYIKA